MQATRIAKQVTFAFVFRGRELFLAVAEDGRPTSEQRLGTAADDELSLRPHEPSEQGEFNHALLLQGGPSFEHYTLRITGCTVELLRRDADDIGNRTEDSVTARFTIAPGIRVWAG
jgi:hypothetical protein